MFEIFKTNVKKADQAKALLEILRNVIPFAEINFDLDDCDQILRVKGGIFSPSAIIRILEIKGFDCKVLD